MCWCAVKKLLNQSNHESCRVNLTFLIMSRSRCNAFSFPWDVGNNDALMVCAFIASNHLLMQSRNHAVVSAFFGIKLTSTQNCRADAVVWLRTAAAMLTRIFWYCPGDMWAAVKFGTSFSCLSSCICTSVRTWSKVTQSDGKLADDTMCCGSKIDWFSKQFLTFFNRCGVSAMKYRWCWSLQGCWIWFVHPNHSPHVLVCSSHVTNTDMNEKSNAVCCFYNFFSDLFHNTSLTSANHYNQAK